MEAIAIRLEAIASRLEAIAIRVEAIASRLEAIAIRVEAIASRLETIAIRLEAIASRLEAIAISLEAIVSRLEAIAIRLEAIASSFEAIAIRLEAIATSYQCCYVFTRKKNWKRSSQISLMPGYGLHGPCQKLVFVQSTLLLVFIILQGTTKGTFICSSHLHAAITSSKAGSETLGRKQLEDEEDSALIN